MNPHTLIIAEAGVNHNGSVDLACKLVAAAANSGADVVKFQTFRAADIATADAKKAQYQRSTRAEESQQQLLSRLELAPQDYRTIADECRSHSIQFLSTPFDFVSADVLAEIGVEAFKFSSGDITNHPFLKYVAKLGKPLILSTGMATLGEVEAALEAIHSSGNKKVSLLHCVSEYPAPAEDMNLRCLETMRDAFRVPVGLSDHSEGIDLTIAAVALGAEIIEKHFTLDRDMEGPDHRASIEPEELKAMVRSIRRVEQALGDGIKRPKASELKNRDLVRKSLVATRDLPAGTVLAIEDISFKRPGSGIPPSMVGLVIGRILRHPLKRDEQITWAVI